MYPSIRFLITCQVLLDISTGEPLFKFWLVYENVDLLQFFTSGTQDFRRELFFYGELKLGAYWLQHKVFQLMLDISSGEIALGSIML